MEKMNNPYESLDLNTRIALAEDINTPLEILATDKNHYVLEAVSGNPSTPEKILTRLIEDYNIRTFSPALKNPSFSAELLTRLSKSKYWYVREFVTQHPNVPVSVLELLSNDESSEVRENIADNSIY